jgi:nucleoside-diphosphate-sugar epimerase
MALNDPILVTGAAGLVGRAVCAAIAEQHKRVLPLARTRIAEAPANTLAVDLTKVDLLECVSTSPAAIIHLAAAVPHSSRYPDTEQTALQTMTMDGNVLRAARSWGCPVVYMSTCGLYDRRLLTIKLESNREQIKVESPYFAAKLAGEAKFLELGNATIARLSAPLGRGLKCSVVAARFIAEARKNSTIKLWGSGRREQDFVHVADVATLVLAAIENPKSDIVNVASGTPTTMATLAETVVRVVGSGRIVFADEPDPRDGETARYSIDRAHQLFGWSPRYSLADALRALSDETFSE